LFTGGGGAGSEALARLLARDYEVHFADADPEARAPSIERDCWHVIPFAADTGFVGGVRALCERLAVDVLVPGVDEELLPLARARESFGCHVLLPSASFIETHLDKLASAHTLAAGGIPVPRTESVANASRVAPPCIVKPRRGRGSRGVAVVRTSEELSAQHVLSRIPADELVLQELMTGQEFTVMMAADLDGRLRAVVPVRVAIKRGITLRAATAHDAAVIGACEAIHAMRPVAGLYNIQLIRTDDGGAMPFEINPRISTTACLALAAGVDFIAACLTQDAGRVAGLADFRDGVGLRRSWVNEFVELTGNNHG
jgi:carbamoyl-phosphate synthase large subunit